MSQQHGENWTITRGYAEDQIGLRLGDDSPLDSLARWAADFGRVCYDAGERKAKNEWPEFSWCRYSVVPEIPYIEDVLYALRIIDEGPVYDFCVNNHEVYVSNVHLVAAIVATQIFGLKTREEMEVLIAQTILRLIPADATQDGSVVEALKIVKTSTGLK